MSPPPAKPIGSFCANQKKSLPLDKLSNKALLWADLLEKGNPHLRCHSSKGERLGRAEVGGYQPPFTISLDTLRRVCSLNN